jgi:dethiobiotin synthetase
MADLAIRLGLPVILVAGLKLGCINHALLSAHAIQDSGLELAGWVANVTDPDMLELDANLATLQQMMGVPLLGLVPYLDDPTPQRVAACLAVDLSL